MLKGEITIPSDKSISHRALILGALTKGKFEIRNFLNSKDCLSTLKILEKTGVKFDFIEKNRLYVNAENAFSIAPCEELYCGNSGTTMRLLSGIMSRMPYKSALTGDDSLSLRPMKRIIEPLSLMGARIKSNDFKAPLEFEPANLEGINYFSKISSAQVKSSILLAGLGATGVTTVHEPYLSRNHTEIMLEYLGADIQILNDGVNIKKSELTPKHIEITGDISSAAFFIVAALIIPNSDILIKNVGINPTRTGILDVIKEMGADFEILNERFICNEKTGDIRVKYTENLLPVEIKGAIIPRLIDELPIIALLATQANGVTIVKDANDLRNKESDRINALVSEFLKLGINIKENDDGFEIYGKSRISGGADVSSHNDHRLAMTLKIASLIADNPVNIINSDCIDISFPNFFELINKLRDKI